MEGGGGGDLWSSRLSSSSSSSRRYQLRYEAFLGGDDIDIEEEYKQEFSCPFCADEFDIVGLFCHMDDEHQVEVKQGVCPVCAKRVGMDMVSHITMQHGNILKVPRKRRLRRGGIPSSMFNILRKELREGNKHSLFGGSSCVLPSSNPNPDPLLSSFMYNSSSTEELKKEEPHSFKETTSLPKVLKESNTQSVQPPLSKEDHEEKSRKCEFIQGLLLSTILDE